MNDDDLVMINLWFGQVHAHMNDKISFFAWADKCQLDGTNFTLLDRIPSVGLCARYGAPVDEYRDVCRMKGRSAPELDADISFRMRNAPAVMFRHVTPGFHLHYPLERNPNALPFLLAAAFSGCGLYMQVRVDLPRGWDAAKEFNQPLVFDAAHLSTDTSDRADRNRPTFTLQHSC